MRSSQGRPRYNSRTTGKLNRNQTTHKFAVLSSLILFLFTSESKVPSDGLLRRVKLDTDNSSEINAQLKLHSLEHINLRSPHGSQQTFRRLRNRLINSTFRKRTKCSTMGRARVYHIQLCSDASYVYIRSIINYLTSSPRLRVSAI